MRFPILGTFIYLCKKGILRVIAKKILRSFWELHNDCEQALKSWHKEASNATWANLNELKSGYPNVSILDNNRVCFNIKGNHYRLIVKINFNHQMMWIRFIGTHPEYDKIDADNI